MRRTSPEFSSIVAISGEKLPPIPSDGPGRYEVPLPEVCRIARPAASRNAEQVAAALGLTPAATRQGGLLREDGSPTTHPGAKAATSSSTQTSRRTRESTPRWRSKPIPT